MNNAPDSALALFSAYLELTGVPTLEPAPGRDPALLGRRLGVINGSSWISLWSTYFGRLHLPGVQLVQTGCEAVQLNFMGAHRDGRPCPPAANIAATVRAAGELVDLYPVDALLLTCSTMNRAAGEVRRALAARGVPVVQIDEPLMEEAAARGGRLLVVATHGPTVQSTQALLQETATRLGTGLEFEGLTVPEAFLRLGQGRVAEHNELLTKAIRRATARTRFSAIVLAQLSMSILSLAHPHPEVTLGAPLLHSGDCGFRRVGELLRAAPRTAPTPSHVTP